jgi:S1-C subfamily serine protease
MRTGFWLLGDQVMAFSRVCFGFVFTLLGAVGWLTAGPANAQDAMRIAQLVLPATVLMVMLDRNEEVLGQGTGFVIAEGLVATNAHMVEGAHYGGVSFVGQQGFFDIEAVLGLDIKNDIAIVAVPGIGGTSALRIGDSNSVQIGQPVIAVGNPKGLEGTVSDGIVSAIRYEDGDKVFQISAPISPGSSGGPILNLNGEVIGIAKSGIPDGENLGFAVPSSFLLDLLAAPPHPTSLAELASNTRGVSGQPRFANTNSVGNGVNIVGLELDECTVGQASTNVAFSIRNQTSDQIARVDVLVILYGPDGKPTESFQRTHLTDVSDLLIPGAETSVSHGLSCEAVNAAGWTGLGEIPNTVEIRVLDFSVGTVTMIDRTNVLRR